VCAEPGLRKSRLLGEFEASSAGTAFARYDGSPYHQDTALYPFIRQVRRSARFNTDDSEQTRTEKLETLKTGNAQSRMNDLARLADVLELLAVSKYPLADVPPRLRKNNTLQVVLHQLLAEFAHTSTVVVIEDAQWLDPTAVELIGLISEAIIGLPILLVVTYRPQFTPP
jgi:predicted ATPase